jgi:hypothetical protein
MIKEYHASKCGIIVQNFVVFVFIFTGVRFGKNTQKEIIRAYT